MLSVTIPAREKNPHEFSLTDLDILVADLGSAILRQLDSAQEYHSINRAKSVVISLLEKQGLHIKDVFVDRGDCSGFDLEQVFGLLENNCMMQERLSG